MKQDDKLFTMEETLDLLRRQKHDHLNHLQVIYSYLQLKKPDQAHDYLRKIIREIKDPDINVQFLEKRG